MRRAREPGTNRDGRVTNDNHAPRRTPWITSSSLARKRERSFGVIGVGPPVKAPPWRSSSIKARVARALPISLSVKGWPLGLRTRASFSRQRAANGMSLVSPTLALDAPTNYCGWTRRQSSTGKSMTAGDGGLFTLMATNPGLPPWPFRMNQLQAIRLLGRDFFQFAERFPFGKRSRLPVASMATNVVPYLLQTSFLA